MVHDAGLAGDVLGDRDALVLRLVREHRAGHDVADRPDAGDLGAEVVVGLDLAALVGSRPAASRSRPSMLGLRPIDDEHRVGRRASSPRRPRRARASRSPCRRRRSTPVTLVDSLSSKPCFLKSLATSLRTSPSKPGRIWSRNSTTVTFAPSRRQTLPSSSPITPPPMTTRCSGTLGSASAPVESTTTFWSISTPGSGVTDEPVAMTMFFAAHGLVADLDGVRVRERGTALQPVDLVLLEQELDAAGQLLDRLAPSRRASGRGRARRRDLDAELGERAVGGLLEQLGRVEQRLGRDAPDVEARAAQRLARLGARGRSPSCAARIAAT